MFTHLTLRLTLLTTLLLITACATRPNPPASPLAMEENAPDPSPVNANVPPAASATPDSLQKKITDLAVADLATRLTLDLKLIKTVSTEALTWPNAALGCPQPDKTYAQGTVPGFRIKLVASGAEYVYHADRKGTLIQCPQANADEVDASSPPVSPDDTLGGQIP